MTNYDSYVNLLLRSNLIPEIDKELATRSLLEFIEQAWPVLQPATPFVPSWHIDALCEHLETHYSLIARSEALRYFVEGYSWEAAAPPVKDPGAR